ncbi:alpha/beta fold hydrolase [Hoyosella altamirensis]|uniref:Pimeloyl-ACP methyl ester carboxylesterase n=1 Tax=Hoyosella altamirensis TaxID=616997 RepID=A0A839RV60_9ACTN|nr:alpha/beta fold hydrolase [Hoyosella altamirensis]MBB3039681.1 pimeloyl-ACP methyl ester carboxylesterase [Hoyosella altamirensis]
MTERMRQFSHAGFTFDVLDSGPLGGEPVILLHGFPQRASCWVAVMDHLNQHGYRTYALDQRGYSPGARPKGRMAYRMSELVGDARAMIDATGADKVHVAGHDWGAIVAWTLASRHPERVRTLTTVSVPHPGAFAASMLRSDQLARSYHMLLFQAPWLPELTVNQFPTAIESALKKSGMTPTQIEAFRSEIVEDGALTGGLNWYRAMVFAGQGGSAKRVHIPTTHVWSDRDPAIGRKSAELTAEYVAAPFKLEVIEGVSHWVPEEAPDVLARIIIERATSGAT